MPQTQGEMTLRDRVVAAIRLNRELVEHLEQGFVPKVHSLRRVTRAERAGDAAPPGDKTVHASAGTVLESDHFTVGVYQKLMSHCESIRGAVEEMTGERTTRSDRVASP